MAELQNKPINKRWPGQHVLRAKVWRPHASVAFEGPIPELTSDLLVLLVGAGEALSIESKSLMGALRTELMRKRPKREANG